MVFRAIFFVLSDGILAMNKFYSLIYLRSFWLMSTYLSAQIMLVYGILFFHRAKKKTLYSVFLIL
jgi:hypothetical protein